MALSHRICIEKENAEGDMTLISSVVHKLISSTIFITHDSS